MSSSAGNQASSLTTASRGPSATELSATGAGLPSIKTSYVPDLRSREFTKCERDHTPIVMRGPLDNSTRAFECVSKTVDDFRDGKETGSFATPAMASQQFHQGVREIDSDYRDADIFYRLIAHECGMTEEQRESIGSPSEWSLFPI